MSSILDALEKSERERNQNSVPQYHDMRPPEESGFRWKWLLVFFALLCFILLVFAALRWLPSIDRGNIELEANQKSVVLDYLRLSELEKSGVPDDRINVVSVSADRERSFVMLGEKMYREGDAITENVTLETIENDHIVFNKQDVLIRRDLE